MRQTVDGVQEQIMYFKETEYIFDCSELLKLCDIISPKDKDDFQFDVRKIDFLKEGVNMQYGIQRYYLKQDVPMLELGYRSILQKNQLEFGHDFKFAAAAQKIIQQKELSSLAAKVLDPAKFQQFLAQVYGQQTTAKKGERTVPGQIIQMN